MRCMPTWPQRPALPGATNAVVLVRLAQAGRDPAGPGRHRAAALLKSAAQARRARVYGVQLAPAAATGRSTKLKLGALIQQSIPPIQMCTLPQV